MQARHSCDRLLGVFGLRQVLAMLYCDMSVFHFHNVIGNVAVISGMGLGCEMDTTLRRWSVLRIRMPLSILLTNLINTFVYSSSPDFHPQCSVRPAVSVTE